MLWGAEVRQTAGDLPVLRLAVIGTQVHQPEAMPFKDELEEVLHADGRSAKTAREVHLDEQHAHAREQVRLLTSDLQEGGQLAALAINLEHADGPIGGIEFTQPAGQRAQRTAQRAVIPTKACHVTTLATRLQPGEMEVYTRHGVVLVLGAEAGCRVEAVHLPPQRSSTPIGVHQWQIAAISVQDPTLSVAFGGRVGSEPCTVKPSDAIWSSNAKSKAIPKDRTSVLRAASNPLNTARQLNH